MLAGEAGGLFWSFFGLFWTCVYSFPRVVVLEGEAGGLYILIFSFFSCCQSSLPPASVFYRLRSKGHITPSYVDITRCLTCLPHKYSERQCASVEKNALFAGMDAESRLLTGNRPLHSESSTRRIWSGLSVPEEDSRP